MSNLHPIFTISISLFLLMDPIGNVPLYVALLKKLPPKRQVVVIIRELIFALIVIYAFYFGGNYFLGALDISKETIQVSGGIILFLIALKMIFPTKHNEFHDDISEGAVAEPILVPLAIPLVAGPSVLAAVMIYSRQNVAMSDGAIAIAIAWIITTLILITSPFLNKILGPRGLTALERLMGLVLTLLAIQMFLEGVGGFIAHPEHFAE